MMKLRFTLLLTLIATITLAQYDVESSQYTWQRKWIGGGGFFMGMAFSTDPGLMYVRSDVCAPHRRDTKVTDEWYYLGDNYPVTADIGGSAGILAHPTDANTIYMLSGSYSDVSNGGLYRSIDRGATWELILNKRVNGNDENSKKLGEPIAVDPNNTQVIYCGTQYDGFYRSTQAGEPGTWDLIASVPEVNKGSRSVVVDPSETIGSSNISKYVYVGVHNDQIYESSDGGLTFSAIPNSPSNPLQMDISPDHELIVGSGDGMYKYTRSNGWTNITPSGYETESFLCVDVDPNDANNLVIALDKEILRSQDGGASWSSVSLADGTISFNTPGFDFIRDGLLSPAAVHFDPHSNDVYVCDAYSVWKTTDVFASSTVWEQQYKNINNTITIDLESPPKGSQNGVLYSASPDVEGFRFNEGERTYGTKYSRLGPNATSIDFCEEQPDVIYFAKSKKWNPRYQARVFRADNGIQGDGGGQYFKSFPHDPEASPGFSSTPTDGSMPNKNAGGAKLAVSATDPMNCVYFAGGSDEATFYTKNGGASWFETSGLPYNDFVRRDCGGGSCSEYDFNIPLAADRVAGNIFYAYYDLTGEVFVSFDGGASWEERTNASLPNYTQLSQKRPFRLESAPYIAGDVWISLYEKGLYHSSDTGKTFTKNPFFEVASQVDLGKNRPGQSIPAVYVFGKANADGQWGVFRSDDLGETWTLITPQSEPGAPNPRCITADRQVYGRVYLGHGSTGIRVGAYSNDPATDEAPAAPSELVGTSPFGDRIVLNWQDNSDNETKFRIYRRTGTNDFVQVGMVGFNTTTFTDLGLTAGSSYEYYVMALNEDGSAASQTISVTTLSENTLPQLNVRVIDNEGTESGNTEAVFEIYTNETIAVDLPVSIGFEGTATEQDDFDFIGNSVTLPANQNSVQVVITPKSDNNPAEGTEQVVLALLNETSYTIGTDGRDSVSIIDDPSTGIPGNVNVESFSPTWARVSWADNSSGEGGFEIVRGETEGGPYTSAGTAGPGQEYFDDTNVEPGMTYYYTVKAINGDNTSDASVEGSGTVQPASDYQPGFTWKRTQDWDGNTSNAGDKDNLNNWAWYYFQNPVDDGDGKDVPSPWYTKPLIFLNEWEGNNWYDGSVTPRISQTQLTERRDVVDEDTYLGIPVVRWVNPVNATIPLHISGTLSTTFGGNDNFDRQADVIVVLKDASGNYITIFDASYAGQQGETFTDQLDTTINVAAGDEIFVSVHQPEEKRYNFSVDLTDDLTFTWVDEGPGDRVVVNSGDDDGGENDTGVMHDNSGSGILLRSGRSSASEKAIFIFRDVEIPQGVTITSARVQFTSRANNTGDSPLMTYLTLEDNLSPDNTTTNISSRTFIGDSVQWDIPVWTDNTTGPDQLTPDISSLLQILVNQQSWTSGSSDVALIIGGHDNNSDNWRQILTQNGGAATELVIEYGENISPDGKDDDYQMLQDEVLLVSTPGVLTNDSDADGDDITASLSQDVSNGTLLFDANGSFSYTPATGFTGTDSFTYLVSDGTVQSNPVTVTIKVDPVLGIVSSGLDRISLYPNPATSYITLEGLNGSVQVMIRNAKGVLVKTLNTTDLEPISVSGLSAGIYWVTFIDENGDNSARKLIIE